MPNAVVGCADAAVPGHCCRSHEGSGQDHRDAYVGKNVAAEMAKDAVKTATDMATGLAKDIAQTVSKTMSSSRP